MKTLHLQITGRVQGVWFRASMHRKAEQLGVTGWVRNRPDGSVEAIVQGAPTAVDALVAWARVGPPQARVERIVLTETDGDYRIFEQRTD